MKLTATPLEIEAGGPLIVVMNRKDAADISVNSSDRIFLRHKDRHAICILNISSNGVKGELGGYKEVPKRLGLKMGDPILVEPARRPESMDFIREKVNGERLTPWKIQRIVGDVVERHLRDIELAAFLTALHIHGVSMEEVEALSRSMIWSGKTISFDRSPILDKHSIGGVPGDKTTLLVAPIVAADGYTIPKNSSRAHTSAAGTADRAEVLMPVNLDIEEMRRVVEKTNGCIV